MGVMLSNLCDCSHKDPRTEINMFLTQNQTIQFPSPLENTKIQRKEPLTSRSSSSNDNKIKDYISKDITEKYIKLKNNKKNIIYNNKLLMKEKNIYAKTNLNKIECSRNNSKIKTFNTDFLNCSNKKIPSKNKEITKRKNFEIYIGDKKGKIKEGLGLQIWDKNTYFFGIYKDNKTNGIGKFISGKTKYIGEFKNDSANGYGIYSNNKLTYEGYWSKDLQNNIGFEKWKDGSIYKGKYFNGKKNGIGTYIWSDGNKYEGEFLNNSFHGYGIYYFNDNKIYLGQWKNNEKNGYGEFITKDIIFIGYYLNDKRNGLGVSFSLNNKKFLMGIWKNGTKIGPYKILTYNKTIYGILDKNGNIQKIKNDNNTFNEILEKENFNKYKYFFNLCYDEISSFFNY